MGIVFNISQNKKKLKDLFVNRPIRRSVHPSQLKINPAKKKFTKKFKSP